MTRVALEQTLPPMALELVGADYKDMISFARRELAGDFIFLDVESAIAENTLAELPLCELGKTWWVFAKTGSGDLWALRKKRGGKSSEVAFIDHDHELQAKPQPMSLSLTEWFRLADLIAQLEQVIRDNSSLRDKRGKLVGELSASLEREMDHLSMGLSQRYPYRF